MSAAASQPGGQPVPCGDSHPATVVPLRADSLADGVLILLALSVVQRLAGFVREVLSCRWLEPEQLGLWNMAWGFVLLAAPMVVLSLPGTFGRYVERYRQRGQLRLFLRRTAAFCAVLSVLGAAAIYLARRWFSHAIFDTDEQSGLVAWVAASLLCVIAYNYLLSLFTALRNMRLVSGLELANSVAFAALAVGLLWGWRCSAGSVVLAYGGACLLCSLGSLWWLRDAWRASPESLGPQAKFPFWATLARFSAAIVVVNLLTNLFMYADRYMIIHYAPGGVADRQALVGDYHSSRVLPLLLVSIAGMLAAMLLPHLSHDWEAGRRERVSARMNLFLKMLALTLTAAAAAVLLLAPLLFNVALRGKYADGLAVLPWALVYCVWFGVATVAQMYLWCVERASLASIALGIGLAVGVALNFALLPRMGLLGAVLATAAANLVVLALTLWFCRRTGLGSDRGLWVVLAAPLALCLGAWITLLVLAAMAWKAVASDRLLSRDEKARLADVVTDYVKRLRIWRAARFAGSEQR